MEDADDNVLVVLSEEAFEQVLAQLDAPAERNPGLQALLEVTPPWSHGST